MTEDMKNSIRPNPNGDWPKVDPTAYIDPTAQIIGKVSQPSHRKSNMRELF